MQGDLWPNYEPAYLRHIFGPGELEVGSEFAGRKTVFFRVPSFLEFLSFALPLMNGLGLIIPASRLPCSSADRLQSPTRLVVVPTYQRVETFMARAFKQVTIFLRSEEEGHPIKGAPTAVYL